MTESVISVTHLGKKYRIGVRDKKSDTIMGSIISGITSPLRNLRNIRNLARLDGEDESTFWAIKDINFEVHQGEVLGIIGHNGAGKSTLLKILSQITEPSEGEVIIRGRVSSLLEVGTGFHPELTGRENVYMNGTILGMTKKEIDQKFDEIVEFSGVQKYIDTPVKFYSSGMKVRLGFAVAAHLEPDILIIDEVLSVGDAEFQKKCLGKMEDVARQGRTVLFVSHDLMAVQNLCTRALLLKKGNIVSGGNTSDVISDYRSNVSGEKHSAIFVFDDLLKQLKSDFFRTTSLKVRNDNTENSPIYMGDNIHFDIEYIKDIDITLVTDIAIVLKNQNLIPVVTFNTVFQKAPINLVSMQGKFTCSVMNLLITPGKYYIHLWISVNNKVAEIIENAGNLEIVEKDIFKSGILPNQRNHGFLVHKDYQFKI